MGLKENEAITPCMECERPTLQYVTSGIVQDIPYFDSEKTRIKFSQTELICKACNSRTVVTTTRQIFRAAEKRD